MSRLHFSPSEFAVLHTFTASEVDHLARLEWMRVINGQFQNEQYDLAIPLTSDTAQPIAEFLQQLYVSDRLTVASRAALLTSIRQFDRMS